jgi:hypothetical protein
MRSYVPRYSAYRLRLVRVLPVLAILVVLVYWRFRQPTSVFLIEWIAVVVIATGYTILYFRNTRITAQARTLTLRNALATSHTVAQHHLDRAVVIEQYVTSRNPDARSVPRLLILDDEGGAVLRWSGQVWTEAQMRELAEALDIPTTVLPMRLGSADIRRRYPRALGFWEANPIAGAVLVILALVGLTVIVLTGLNH